MIVTLHNTEKTMDLVVNGVPVPVRIWEGWTDNGIACHAYITLIAADGRQDCAAFDRELKQVTAPTPAIAGLPARMVL